MFWKTFLDLCVKKGVAPTTVGVEMGLTGATVGRWKKGSIPKETTLIKISKYFGAIFKKCFIPIKTEASFFQIPGAVHCRKFCSSHERGPGSVSCNTDGHGSRGQMQIVSVLSEFQKTMYLNL